MRARFEILTTTDELHTIPAGDRGGGGRLHGLVEFSGSVSDPNFQRELQNQWVRNAHFHLKVRRRRGSKPIPSTLAKFSGMTLARSTTRRATSSKTPFLFLGTVSENQKGRWTCAKGSIVHQPHATSDGKVGDCEAARPWGWWSNLQSLLPIKTVMLRTRGALGRFRTSGEALHMGRLGHRSTSP